MDVFVEQLIRRKGGVPYFLAVFGLTLAALAIIAVSFLFLGGMIGALLIVGAGYGWWWLFRNLTVEYEYSVTNGDIDIDLIRGKSRRQRIVSVRGEKIESMARYAGEDLTRYDRVVKAISGDEGEELWIFTYQSKKNGRTAVVFQPEERVLTALIEGLPYLLQRDVKKQLEQRP